MLNHEAVVGVDCVLQSIVSWNEREGVLDGCDLELNGLAGVDLPCLRQASLVFVFIVELIKLGLPLVVF